MLLLIVKILSEKQIKCKNPTETKSFQDYFFFFIFLVFCFGRLLFFKACLAWYLSLSLAFSFFFFLSLRSLDASGNISFNSTFSLLDPQIITRRSLAARKITRTELIYKFLLPFTFAGHCSTLLVWNTYSFMKFGLKINNQVNIRNLWIECQIWLPTKPN